MKSVAVLVGVIKVLTSIKFSGSINVLGIKIVTVKIIKILGSNPIMYKLLLLRDNADVHLITRWFLARDVIYTSRAYATMSVSVCLSVCL